MRWRIVTVSYVLLAAACFLLYLQIQNQRKDSIRRACREQNARHDDTLRKLDRGLALAEMGASPARIRMIEDSKKFTVLLIEALAPKQDCEKLVERST